MHYDAPTRGQMSNSVTIKVPARLHLGFLDPNGDFGTPFRQPRSAAERAGNRRDAVACAGDRRSRDLKAIAPRASDNALPASRHPHRTIVWWSSRPSRAMPGWVPARRSRLRWRPRCARCTACRSISPATRPRLARGTRSGIGIASFDKRRRHHRCRQGRQRPAAAGRRTAAFSGGMAGAPDPRP